MALANAVSFARHDTYTQPLFAWVPSITVSSLAYVSGFNNAWDGDLLVGTLTDMSLHRIRLQGDRVVYAERIPIGSRIRYVLQHTDGRIVLWTDNEELIFLEGHPRIDEHARLEDYLDGAKLSETTKKGVRVALDRCSERHAFLTDQPDGRSPGLSRIYQADIASTAYTNYSSALRTKPGQWTRENLAAFLADPSAFAPGTHMPSPQIHDPKVIDAVIGYLAALRIDH